ncbi:MAG: helix-turn-helix transcriptional regulator [Lachnospiraceae bacterium]|nr:helix-turn-helix transcriptional regulator [Lachnospiraceae bacterium]
METVNPYHFVTNCISGKWKMTILHHIHHYGKIRFNETKKTLGVSEKVLSQQLKDLAKDGLVERIQYNTIPLKVEYILTPLGKDLIPALDILYVWSIRRLNELHLPIDPDAFKVHDEMKYQDQLMDIMDSYIKNQDPYDQ